jgi:tetratricopeptide (TPR) repeat protein
VAPPQPSAEERAQAAELTSSSDQALMLGDLPRALALLDRATEIDAASAELAYRRARVLEDLAETSAAVDEYCRAHSLAPEDGIRDAQARLQSLVEGDRAALPGEAIVAFTAGLTAVDRGSLSTALAAFERAASRAPNWSSAEYNRGVVLARQGRGREAATALLRYLELRPDAPDAIAVLQRVGQLQSLAVRDGPSPGITVALGVLLPGMGHFYAGRPVVGSTVLAVAGGALAAGYLVKEVDVRCLTSVPSGERCPESEVVSRRTGRPYLTIAVGVAAAAGVIGAIEAFLDARGRRTRPTFSSNEAPGPTLEGPAVALRAGRVELSLLRLRLR